MITWLRTFLASWRRSLLVAAGCLAYVAVVHLVVRVFPQVPPSLGRARLIIAVLYVLAGTTMTYIGMFIAAHLLAAAVGPVLNRAFPYTPFAERSDKAKEKHADGLMSVSNALFSATIIALLVAPLTAFLQAVVGRKDLGALLSPFLTPGGLPAWQVTWQVIMLLVLLFLPAVASDSFRTRALDIYDELARKATPTPSPGPNGATAALGACPVSADPPTTA